MFFCESQESILDIYQIFSIIVFYTECITMWGRVVNRFLRALASATCLINNFIKSVPQETDNIGCNYDINLFYIEQQII